LVLQVDYGLTDRRGKDEPTGEVMALSRDKLRGIKMGDKFQRNRAPVAEKKTKFVDFDHIFVLK
jgi:pre-mRNA-splicing helicase BRR2